MQLFKSFLMGTILCLMTFVLFNISVKAQSVEGTSWTRSAERVSFSETYTFNKNGKVSLYRVAKGKHLTYKGTYTQHGNLLELNFPVTDRGARSPKYNIKDNRLIPSGFGSDIPDTDIFKRVKK